LRNGGVSVKSALRVIVHGSVTASEELSSVAGNACPTDSIFCMALVRTGSGVVCRIANEMLCCQLYALLCIATPDCVCVGS